MAPGVVRVERLFVVTSASDKNGLSYRILAGYNYQVGQLVLGVEGDLQGWTVGEIRYTAVTGNFLTAHSKWGGTIRGRLGCAADHALLYVTGGAAFVSNKTSIPFTGISIGGEDARVGWTVGAGLDYAFTNNWFAGLEYRYLQYQAKTFVYPIPILNLGLVGFRQELSSNHTALGASGGEERIESATLRLRRHAPAVVGESDLDLIHAEVSRVDQHVSAGSIVEAVGNGVEDEVSPFHFAPIS